MTRAERIEELGETAKKWNGSMPQDRPTDLAMYKALRDALPIIEELEAENEKLKELLHMRISADLRASLGTGKSLREIFGEIFDDAGNPK